MRTSMHKRAVDSFGSCCTDAMRAFMFIPGSSAGPYKSKNEALEDFRDGFVERQILGHEGSAARPAGRRADIDEIRRKPV